MKPIDIGQHFGMLEVVNLETSIETPKGKPSRAYAVCRCVCGKTKTIRRSSLFRGDSKTCGGKECVHKSFLLALQKKGKAKGKYGMSPDGYMYGISSDGYLRARSGHGFIYIHRQTMEKHLGRKLKKDEVVHHRNGIKTDNRIENLEVLSSRVHSKKHFERLIEIASLKKRVDDLEMRVMKLECERSRLVLAS